jgi:hypothetical protein
LVARAALVLKRERRSSLLRARGQLNPARRAAEGNSEGDTLAPAQLVRLVDDVPLGSRVAISVEFWY